MMRAFLQATVFVCLAALGIAAAAPAYYGTWKLNPSKSDFGQLTVMYEQAPGGAFKATMDGLSYTFTMDNKPAQTPWGTTDAWKPVDATTWQTTSRANGKLVGTASIKLSPDGKTLTVNSKMMKVTGETSDSTMTFQRVSGSTGLTGTWKAAKLQSSSPGVLSVAGKGADGLVLTFVDQNGVCDAKLDGKDYPAAGPLWPAGWTCALSPNGANAFDVSWKKDGRPMYKSTFTASADGKTLTETGGAVGTTEKIKAVYDRQ